MSSVYVLEPPTKGKVVLNTTGGPLDIELWPKEAPKAVRNFVQLCVDGYYNGTTFHRLIKTFMVQGGDPTGTGTGGDTIYGGPFNDEIHSRLRFNHRGVVACANAGTPHSNNSQFFITFDRCDWLDKKNTIFGKITGDTVYNLMKIGDLETDKEDRPVDPPVINSVEVLWNPFDDLVPRDLKPKKEATLDDKSQKPTAKPKKKLNLLSFGEEAEAEEQAVEIVKAKIKSSHDVLQDPRLLKEPVESAEVDPVEARRVKGVQTAVRQALSKKDNNDDAERKPSGTVDGESSGDEDDFEASMRKKVLEKRARLSDSKGAGAGNNKKKEKKGELNVKKEAPFPRDNTRRVVDDSDDEKEERKEKLSLKKGMGSEARAVLAANVDADVQLLTPLEQQRARFKQKKRLQGSREGATLAKLAQFKTKLGHSAKETGADDENWLTHELKFEKDFTKKDDMERNEDPNQYVVHDPLLEKGKEKFNKEQAKFKKRNREWAGNSLT